MKQNRDEVINTRVDIRILGTPMRGYKVTSRITRVTIHEENDHDINSALTLASTLMNEA